MIEPASLIGFALALAVTAWACSILACGGVLLGKSWLRRRGPEVERTAAAGAIVLPVLIAFAVVVALVGRSLAIPLLGLEDHCPAHSHHPHLCLFHGAGWSAHAWAIAGVALVGAVAATRLARLVLAQLATARALRRIRRSAERVRSAGSEVTIAPSPRVFFFVAGLFRPRIYASSAAWAALDEDERRAALLHEQAHAAQGDLGRRVLYGILALLGAPLLARYVLGLWVSATERVCDRRAADVLGDGEPVARALVALARRSGQPAVCASFAPAADELALRVEAILADPPIPRRGHGQRRVGALVISALLMAALVFADSLHHALETFLGML